MTKHFSAEESRQNELLKLELLEDQGQSNPQQFVLKCGDTLLVANTSGDLLTSHQEMGLYRHGTRFLLNCNLYLQGHSLVTLSHQVAHIGNACHIDLTNASFNNRDDSVVEQGAIHISRSLELEQEYLIQSITLTSFHPTTVPVVFSLQVNADFCDLFEVRGWKRTQRGETLPAKQSMQEIILGYRGLDTIERVTQVQFEPAAEYVQTDRVDWIFNLECGKPVEISLKIKMEESNTEKLTSKSTMTLWREQQQPSIITNDPFFNRLLAQGMYDLMMLSTMTPHGYYPYAGIPWFNCPFGRDGLITALEFLPFYPQVARGTLAFLAAYQGKNVDAFTDEEPGKILHEFRMGEMAHCHETPYIPYYGTVDATPLFLITLEAYMNWTNDIPFLEQLWPNAEAAARWLITYGDKDGDTFIEYHCASDKGLSNQGWKDAWDAISHSDGRIAQSPLALCDVQGYAYAAYRAASRLAKRLGKDYQATYWNRAANQLQTNFLRHFWWEEEQVFYLGLNAQKEPCDVVSSNAGQCLWTGIVPEHLADKLIDRLMHQDMCSGWGMRTLSAGAKRYNPMSYHNGSVWPHDTALIGMGFAQHGRKQEAAILLKSLFDACTYYENARLPELYCGFTRKAEYGPTRYPVSCSPQAWAAGAPFALLSGILGFHADAQQGCLTLNQPMLPEWLNTLELRNIWVGEYHVHLHFRRVDGYTQVIAGSENEVKLRILQETSPSYRNKRAS